MQEPQALANTLEVPDLENLSNAGIIARLERLLDVNELRREMEQVSNFFIIRGRISVELATLNLLQLCNERLLRCNKAIDVDVDHIMLREEEYSII